MGQLLRSLRPNPQNFSEVAPEVRPAVHMALLCLISVLEVEKSRLSATSSEELSEKNKGGGGGNAPLPIAPKGLMKDEDVIP